MHEIKIAKMHEDVILPKKMTIGACGYDIFSHETRILSPRSASRVSTGLRLELPKEIICMLVSRSGLADSKYITVLNSPAIIDRDYRGELFVLLNNGKDIDYTINKGDRICQAIFIKEEQISFNIVDDSQLASTQRNENGFGSTGT